MVLRAKLGEVMWNGTGAVSAEDDAYELMSFGKRDALDICREELERATDPEEISHWIEVRSIIVAEPCDDKDEDVLIEQELPHPDQLSLRLS
jgi:hypothetical protein